MRRQELPCSVSPMKLCTRISSCKSFASPALAMSMSTWSMWRVFHLQLRQKLRSHYLQRILEPKRAKGFIMRHKKSFVCFFRSSFFFHLSSQRFLLQTITIKKMLMKLHQRYAYKDLLFITLSSIGNFYSLILPCDTKMNETKRKFMKTLFFSKSN